MFLFFFLCSSIIYLLSLFHLLTQHWTSSFSKSHLFAICFYLQFSLLWSHSCLEFFLFCSLFVLWFSQFMPLFISILKGYFPPKLKEIIRLHVIPNPYDFLLQNTKWDIFKNNTWPHWLSLNGQKKKDNETNETKKWTSRHFPFKISSVRKKVIHSIFGSLFW